MVLARDGARRELRGHDSGTEMEELRIAGIPDAFERT
jgi:hypothetical protein